MPGTSSAFKKMLIKMSGRIFKRVWHKLCSDQLIMFTPIGLECQSDYLVAEKALDLCVLKHKATAANIANHETPGYKRVGISDNFSKSLERYEKNHQWADYRAARATLAVDDKAPMLRPDGNTVSLDHELTQMADNAIEFEFAANHLSDSLKQLQTAISGRVS